ncbi:S8 family serine peptidase [Streptomyces sp. NPDC051907]|uniref:S8 family serine peptidase n=1 Tax=Streptomyces sp. NPDC051907 TaxID=3155284 RepID=UPI003441A369
MRVIAYCMSEEDFDEAARRLRNASVTDSFVVGDVDEADIPALEAAGLTIDRLDANPRAETAAMGRDRITGVGVREQETPEAEAAPLEPGVAAMWILQLGGPLLGEYRGEIEALGVTLERAVPTNAYLVNATREQADGLLALPFAVSVERYGPQLAEPVRVRPERPGGSAELGEEETVESSTGGRVWDLRLTGAEVRPQVVAWLEEHTDSQGLRVVADAGHRVRIELAEGSALENQIPQVPGVLEMVEYVPPKFFNDVALELLGVTSPAGDGAFPFTGRGQIVGVADTGVDIGHPDFDGRIVDAVALGRPGDSSDTNGHGTHVAGSILGDGAASDGAFHGAAPEAQLYFQSVMDESGGLGGLPLLLADLFEPAYQAGVRIHNNSWGAATASAYTVNSDDVDSYVQKRRDMLVVIAAGNEGDAAQRLHSAPGFVDWASIGSPASCKNALTVGARRSSRTEGGLSRKSWRAFGFPDDPIAGQKISGDPEALAAFSSRGPCDDWRVKPEVVAPGTDILSTRSADAPADHFWGLHGNDKYAYMGGTSMATPLVAGCAALVRQYYVTERQTEPSAALLKATIINGARRLTAEDSTAEHPHFHQGFGAVDMPATVPNPGSADLRLEFVDCWQTPDRQLGSTGERIRFVVEVEEGLPLNVCMAYTDLPGRALQNDLSVILQAPGGAKHPGNGGLPNQLFRTDSTNNVEVVRLDSPPAGRYLIQIFARNLLKGPQDYALVVTGKLAGSLREPG